jgi:hypothetical protein
MNKQTNLAAGGASDVRTKVIEHAQWTSVEAAVPQTEVAVIVWNNLAKRPDVAFFDADEDRWHSMHDGSPFDQGAVTHWRTWQAPARRAAASHTPGQSVDKTVKLTIAEAKVLRSYRAMDLRRRSEYKRYGAVIAKAFPR